MAADGTVNYYEILGVARTAGTAEIRTAYRARIGHYHPDRNQSGHATAIAALLNEAWSVLSDPDKRRRYDSLQDRPEGGASPRTTDAVTVPAVRPVDRSGPRRSARLKTLLNVWVRGAAATSTRCTCLDVSTTGMALTFAAYVRAGNHVTLVLDLPGGAIDVEATVVRCDPLKRHNRWKVAVVFLPLDEEQKRRIDAFIEWERNERLE
jgi:hypothetical protein